LLRKIRMAKRLLVLLGLPALLYLALLIPESNKPVAEAGAKPVTGKTFAWKQDAFWRQLETEFRLAKSTECSAHQSAINELFNNAWEKINIIQQRSLAANDSLFRNIEQTIFNLAPLLAACPERLPEFSTLVTRLRQVVKQQSLRWDMNDFEVRSTMYRLLYGGRAAVEEVMLQAPVSAETVQLTRGVDEPSATPWAVLMGVTIHSGDILVSRGGAATSALIARGNDFAGNFSHVALVYVDPKTHLIRIIESHIERGVTVSKIDDYINDVKLRILVLRLRSDLLALQADPMLPHRAAEWALHQAESQHIPYDFSMDFSDDSKWFCSEAASSAYRHQGINLWMGLSHISAPGLRRWLAQVGVRFFATQEPSDLEYDPQLQVVAEWRDLETLRKDHYDNAVTEVLLDAANTGAQLKYNRFALPAARLIRLYSLILNKLGRVGPVPEGMTATTGLRIKWFTKMHEKIKIELMQQAVTFQKEMGYAPPYWQLVDTARYIYEQKIGGK
jgi:hypothetical protein